MNQKVGTIYIATNLVNGKQYVGQTINNFYKRMKSHKNGKTNQACLLTRAIKKYEFENFKWVSFSCLKKDLDWQETFLIKELNTLAPNGYNLDSGGHKNKQHNDVTKEKIRIKAKERFHDKTKHPMFKKHHTKEAKEKISNSHKGKHHNQKTIEKMRINNAGENNPMYGVHRFGKNNPMFGKKRPDIIEINKKRKQQK